MQQYIDTHTHLFLEQFDHDRDEVIKRAIDKGVTRMIMPNVDSSTIDRLLDLTSHYPNNLFPAMGLHPTSVKENYKQELETIYQLLVSKKFYGIGEIGIDLYWDKTFKNEQADAFRTQIRWAKELDLPIIIHTRDSFDIAFSIVSEENDQNLRGVFHCFTGNHEQAMKIAGLGGFYIGIGGVLTFKNSKLGQSIKNVPLDIIVLETDSPFLTPHPHRGKRNESSYLTLIAQKLAEIKETPIEQIAKITTENALQLFRLP